MEAGWEGRVKALDVVTIGETMALFIPTSVGPMRYAGQFEKSIGGAESNVAIGLSRLGHQCGWISRLGQDEFGLYIRNFIRGEGVDTSQVHFDEKNSTAVFFKERQMMQEPKISYYRKNSAASEMSPDDLNEEYIAKANYLHVTGITPALSPSCKEMIYEAIRMAKKHGVTVVFDPNIRLKLWSNEEARETLMAIARESDIVLPGLEEGFILTGEIKPDAIANQLIDNGAKLVVVKLGAEGAYYANQTETGLVPGFPVEHVVDPIGAGDAFAAGLLSGLLREFPLREAVKLANQVGAYALTVAGDVEGLPFWSQVDPNRKQEVYR
ncbi:MAG TPA: sugar kinase [Desulfosporosinus sp.]|nr:sugar kinase [Desulfosporosinus sp.]